MRYAIEQLGFAERDMLVFAWSIGGFTASWAASRHQGVRGLLLDATFDSVGPLATAKMPPTWRPLVDRVIRSYLDLDVARHMLQYPGCDTLFVLSTNHCCVAQAP